jgi:hypothetical protein
MKRRRKKPTSHRTTITGPAGEITMKDIHIHIPKENFKDAETYAVNIPPRLPQDLKLHSYVDTILCEFVCTGCLGQVYIPAMVLGEEFKMPYPDLDLIEKRLIESEALKPRHLAPVYADIDQKLNDLPGGYAFCGIYKIARLWRMWENPNRYQNEEYCSWCHHSLKGNSHQDDSSRKGGYLARCAECSQCHISP